jgi:hypothetical protein
MTEIAVILAYMGGVFLFGLGVLGVLVVMFAGRPDDNAHDDYYDGDAR